MAEAAASGVSSSHPSHRADTSPTPTGPSALSAYSHGLRPTGPTVRRLRTGVALRRSAGPNRSGRVLTSICCCAVSIIGSAARLFLHPAQQKCKSVRPQLRYRSFDRSVGPSDHEFPDVLHVEFVAIHGPE